MFGLRCVLCRSYDLKQDNGDYRCQECSTQYPVVGDVGIMFAGVKSAPGTRPDSKLAQQILGAFDLPQDVIAVERLRHLFSKKMTFGDDLIQTEAAQFLDRVRNSGHELDFVDETVMPAAYGAVGNEFVKPLWVLDYIPRRLPPDQDQLANVRFENVGTAPMRHAGEGRVTIATRWARANGETLDMQDIRTPLPLDILPGRAITVPVRFQTPRVEGDAELSLVLVEEGVRFLDDDTHKVSIHIVNENRPQPWAGWSFNQDQRDYDQDHVRGLELLEGWVKDHAPAHPRILEIGGNAIPMIERLEGDLHNVDVDLLGLQICAMRQRQAGRSMTSICADAQDLPYQSSFFDVIVIFASLHHFPKPGGLLAALVKRLKPQGFIAVMCEPVGHIWPGAVLPEFLAELRRGVNEQSFTSEEYLQIFRLAELQVAEAVVDKASLKARLVPKGEAR
jgi:SAM-dependent methyltransferase